MIDYLKQFRITRTSPAAAAAAVILLLAIFACSRNDSVIEYFRSHGMEYPADVTGIGMLSMLYVGISEEDLQEEGASDFVQEGVVFVKAHFGRKSVQSLMPGVEAIVVNKPVLYRAADGKVGLMVRVKGYGTDEPPGKDEPAVEWQGKDRSFWKVENFAWFGRSGYDRWEFGGWVY